MSAYLNRIAFLANQLITKAEKEKRLRPIAPRKVNMMESQNTCAADTTTPIIEFTPTYSWDKK